MSTIILIIGLMIFLAHFLALLFRRTNLPDVLVLMGVGLLAGPLMGWVTPDHFGRVGPVMATVALVVILFEGGTTLRIDTVRRALGTTGRLSLACFALTAVIVAGIAYSMLDLAPWPSVLLGIILAGTSSAVVIPMVNSLRPSEQAGTALILESALTDVLCIVGVFALLQVIAQGHIEPGPLIGSVLSALLFATCIGVLGGAGWLMILGRVRDFPNTISSTIAYAFIVYGVTDSLGFSGAIAVMALGITLTNFETMGLKRLKWLRGVDEALTPVDRAFYSEAVFLLKTYFFFYLGISIQFNGWLVFGAALSITALVVVMRTALTRKIFAEPRFSLRDAALVSMLSPKGLAAAVLASVPLQHGVPGAEVIRDAAYMVVLVSITVCAMLVAVLPSPAIQRIYAGLLRKSLPDSITSFAEQRVPNAE